MFFLKHGVLYIRLGMGSNPTLDLPLKKLWMNFHEVFLTDVPRDKEESITFENNFTGDCIYLVYHLTVGQVIQSIGQISLNAGRSDDT